MAEQDYLLKIHETERQADEMIGQAREKARLAKEDAQKQAALLFDESRADALQEAKRIMDEAEEKAGKIMADSLSRAKTAAMAAEPTAAAAIAAEKFEEAVRLVAERIVSGHADH